MINNLDSLKALMEHYGVGRMEVADLIGYSYDGVRAWFRKVGDPSRANLRTMVLKSIETELALKYSHK